jgi:hypothetical protein
VILTRQRLAVVVIALTGALCGAAAAREEPPPGGVLPPARQAQRVALLRRPGCREYEKVAEEFRSRAQAAVRLLSVVPGTKKTLHPWLVRFRPRLIVVVGQTAYDELQGVKGLRAPIVHLLVFRDVVEQGDPINISSRIPPARVLESLRLARPGIRRVSILHGPSSRAAREAAEAAALELDFELDVMEARSPAQAVRMLRRLSRKAEGLWLPVDLDILTPQVLQYALGLQFRRRVVVAGATRRHAEQGALLALDYEPHSLGRRAASIANRYLAGHRDLQAAPGNIRLSVNRGTAQTLGISTGAFRAAGAEFVQ